MGEQFGAPKVPTGEAKKEEVPELPEQQKEEGIEDSNREKSLEIIDVENGIDEVNHASKFNAYDLKDYPKMAEVVKDLNIVGFDEAHGFHQGDYIRVSFVGNRVYLASFENCSEDNIKEMRKQLNRSFPDLKDYVGVGVKVIFYDITEVWKDDQDALQKAEYARHSEKWNSFRESIAGHPEEEKLERIMWGKPHLESVSNNNGYYNEDIFYVKFNGEDLPVHEAHETVMTVGTRNSSVGDGSYAADYIGAVKEGDKIEWSDDGKTWEEVTI